MIKGIKYWKQPKVQRIENWINEGKYIHTVECCADMESSWSHDFFKEKLQKNKYTLKTLENAFVFVLYIQIHKKNVQKIYVQIWVGYWKSELGEMIKGIDYFLCVKIFMKEYNMLIL